MRRRDRRAKSKEKSISPPLTRLRSNLALCLSQNVITRAVSPLYNELPEIYARFVSRLAYNRPANYFQLPWPRAYQLIIS